jgi:hypothetical protein
VQRHLSFAVAVGVTQILLYAVGLPLVAYVFLWRHRGELDKPVVKFRYGLFFSGFRQERYYWECIVALRKESTVLLAVFGSQMGVAMLAHVALLVFMVQILVQLIGHPYGRNHGKLQILDVSAICLCWGTMWSGFFFYTPRPPDQKAALEFLTMMVLLINTIYMMILLYSMCSEACKEHKDHSIVQVFQKRTSIFRDFARARLPKTASGGSSDINLGVDIINVSNPSLDYLTEVEMTERGFAEREPATSVGATEKAAKPRITRRKSKNRSRPENLTGRETVPSAAQVERRKHLQSIHAMRKSSRLHVGKREIFSNARVRSNPVMERVRVNDDAEVGAAADATTGTADNDAREEGV